MTKEELEVIQNIIEDEGFHYTFQHCSTWQEIKDKKFHQLRKAYINAAKNLEEYLFEEDESEVLDGQKGKIIKDS